MTTDDVFPPPASGHDLETSTIFTPKFDADGLIPAIVTDAGDGAVLMFAWMNREALRLSLETHTAHFWSRSRRKIWLKGEDSGNVLNIEELKVDCDQDVILVRARLAGKGVACHTGARSCFYRALDTTPTAEGQYRLVNLR